MNNVKTFEGFIDYLKNTKIGKSIIKTREEIRKKIEIDRLKREVFDRCNDIGIRNFTVNDDGSINVTGDISISDRYDRYYRNEKPIIFNIVDGDVNVYSSYSYRFDRLPAVFNKVTGNWYCSTQYRGFRTLEGSPKEVGGNFTCRRGSLSSLKGAPEFVGGNFDVSDNRIDNLEGAPTYVGGNFDISGNMLSSLVGITQKIGGTFNFSKNRISSFDNIPDCKLRFDDNPIYLIWYIIELMSYSYRLDMSNVIDLFKAYDPIHPTNYRHSFYGRNSILYISRLRSFMESLSNRRRDPIHMMKEYEVYTNLKDRYDTKSNSRERVSIFTLVDEYYYIRE